jgi:hypothetical protein
MWQQHDPTISPCTRARGCRGFFIWSRILFFLFFSHHPEPGPPGSRNGQRTTAGTHDRPTRRARLAHLTASRRSTSAAGTSDASRSTLKESRGDRTHRTTFRLIAPSVMHDFERAHFRTDTLFVCWSVKILVPFRARTTCHPNSERKVVGLDVSLKMVCHLSTKSGTSSLRNHIQKYCHVVGDDERNRFISTVKKPR